MTAQIKEWVKPGTKQVRRYINNWEELIGLELHYYKSGNISWALFDGEPISNAAARRICNGKVWLDSKNELHMDWHNQKIEISVDEKRTRIITALAAEGIDAH